MTNKVVSPGVVQLAGSKPLATRTLYSAVAAVIGDSPVGRVAIVNATEESQ
jgi:hypothetical protein